MKKESRALDNDRRNYFRIDDIVYLSYRVVAWEEVRSAQKQDCSPAKHDFTIKANLDSLSRELQPLHNLIKSGNPDIAKYLATLDKKINLLAESLTKNTEIEVDEVDIEPQQVNIGAGGLSWLSDKPVIIGAMLEIQMKLLQENVDIFSYARVLTCAELEKSAKQQDYKIAVEFEFMDEDVRDLITRHILNKERALINKA